VINRRFLTVAALAVTTAVAGACGGITGPDIDGRWEGTLTDVNTGQVWTGALNLEISGSTVGGIASLPGFGAPRLGAIAGNYSPPDINFSTSTHQFSGTVVGTTMSGTVEHSGPLGQLVLDFEFTHIF